MKSFIATAALVATTAASNVAERGAGVYNFMAQCNVNEPKVKVVNRCSYPVYLWSIDKQYGCPDGSGFELKTGDLYQENFQDGTDGGISIKLSKFETCGGKDITQLEYKIEKANAAFQGNYLDMSFVDCTGNLEDCPGRTDGFYLKAGNQNGLFKSAVNNEHCPIFNVYNAEEAAKVSYINWDDPQTKWCDVTADLDLYLCGGDAPGDDDSSSAAPVSSTAPVSSAAPSSEIESSSAAPTTTSSSSSSEEAPAPSSTEDAYVVAAAAAVTEAPVASSAPVVKTEVVYVTEFVNRRHAHGRRHQHFHA
ncbi:uncharacterized protein N0V89_001040 [Didymosphaeria variabile]|uniref:Uncharacterized protein n=1 Tax=Didymosphaeria variabile TaxID=1932322 RepID=A0A9W8XWF6_9PLEO|nr:uncharacterized protein N0V89_001040 [Didymosphaeria variabile]KAJ4360476.1 hypothetical protein N0V89_001040 [Didymosphaeria variabile]